MSITTPGHADYPHVPGALYDCPTCEAECHCAQLGSTCVHCAIMHETFCEGDHCAMCASDN